MESYKNLSGQSGVIAYEIGVDSIKVKFRSQKTYTYSKQKINSSKIEDMKRLAIEGRGLATFISQNPDVRDNFD